MNNLLNKIESKIHEMENTSDMNKNIKLYNKTIKLINKFEKKILKYSDDIKNTDLNDNLNYDTAIINIIDRLSEINRLMDNPDIKLEQIIELKLESDQLNNIYNKEKQEININIINKKEN
jgi:hypothetical protein